jgi:hypothetical protein
MEQGPNQLETDEPRIGFCTSPNQEAGFIQDVYERRYSRLELPIRGGLIFLTTGLVCALMTPWVSGQGYPRLGAAMAIITMGFFALAMSEYRRVKGRGHRDAEEHPNACFPDEQGLMPVLGEEEKIVGRVSIQAKTRIGLRRFSGVTQIFWGTMLAGLPMATVMAPTGNNISAGLSGWTLVFTVFGAMVAGRGIRDLTSLQPAKELVLTNQRLVIMACPGAARSLPLEQLRHRPIVLERVDGDATLAFELERLASAGLLPVKGIWGSDGFTVEEARRWASVVIEARAAIVEERASTD